MPSDERGNIENFFASNDLPMTQCVTFAYWTKQISGVFKRVERTSGYEEAGNLDRGGENFSWGKCPIPLVWRTRAQPKGEILLLDLNPGLLEDAAHERDLLVEEGLQGLAL
jgi:hypothetical protein